MLTVDSNEPKEMYQKLKKNLESGEVKRESLDCGDYLLKVDDIKFIVERKDTSKGDYVSSLIDGRLNNQLYDMSSKYHLSILLVEGYISHSLSRRDFSRHQYIASLSKALLKRSPEGKQGQIAIVSTETSYDTRLLLRDMHRHLKEGRLERLPKIPGRKSDPNTATKSILQLIPSIGKKRSQKIYEDYDSFVSLFEAEEKDLQNLLGSKIGQNVFEFIHQKWEEQ